MFVQFRNNDDLISTQKSLSSTLLNGKSIKSSICSSSRVDKSLSDTWCEPKLRTLSDFKWNVIRVLNLPRATTRLDLAQVFPKAVSITMPTYDDGSCKGFVKLLLLLIVIFYQKRLINIYYIHIFVSNLIYK